MLSIKFSWKKSLLLCGLLLLVSFLIVFAANLWLSAPSEIMVTNLTSASATISWVTRNETPGKVIYKEGTYALPIRLSTIGTPVAYDDRDYAKAELKLAEENAKNAREKESISAEDIETEVVVTEVGQYYVHHVTIRGLEPEKSYSFMVGNGSVFHRKGDRLFDRNQFTTFAEPETINPPSPTYGRIIKTDLPITGHNDAVVYMQLDYGEGTISQYYSSATAANGSWYIDVGNVYNVDGVEMPKVHDDMSAFVYVEAGKNGKVTQFSNSTGSDAPMNDLRLLPVSDSDDNDLALGHLLGSPSPVSAAGCRYYSCSNQIIDGKIVPGFCESGYSCTGSNPCRLNSCGTASNTTPSQPPNLPDPNGPAGNTTPPVQEPSTSTRNDCTGKSCGQGSCFTGPNPTDGGWGCDCYWGDDIPASTSAKSCPNQPAAPSQPTTPPSGSGPVATGCEGKQCGVDATGKSCGTCGSGKYCYTGLCVDDAQEGVLGGPATSSGGSSSGSGSTGGGTSGGGTSVVNNEPDTDFNWEPTATTVPVNNQPIYCCGYIAGNQRVFSSIQANGGSVCSQNGGQYKVIQAGSGGSCSQFNAAVAVPATPVTTTGGDTDVSALPCRNILTDSFCPNGANPLQYCRERNFNDFEGPTVSATGTFVYYKCVDPVPAAPQRPSNHGTTYQNMSACESACSDVEGFDGSCAEVEEVVSNHSSAIGNPPSPDDDPTCDLSNHVCRTNSDGYTIYKIKGKCTYTEVSTRSNLTDESTLASVPPTEEDVLGVQLAQASDTDGEEEEEQEAEELVVYDPRNRVYYVVSTGTYRFTYEGVEYTVDIPDSAYTVKIFIDQNSNGTFDEGETEVSGAASALNLKQVATDHTYELKKGFNFISIPFVMLGNNSASALLEHLNTTYGNLFYSIAQFDSSWKIVGSNGGQFNANDFQIVPGVGYLLKTSQDVVITLSGKDVLYESDADQAPVYLTPGWNLIGLYGTGTKSYTAESLIDSVNGYSAIDFTAVNVTRWPVDKGRYEGFQKEADEQGNSSTYGFDFPLNQMSGYFVRVKSGQGNWQPERE